MFRKAWQLLKALVGRQDGRVPVDPEVHASTFGVKPVVVPAEATSVARELLASLTQDSTAVEDAAAVTRELLAPAAAAVQSAPAPAPAQPAQHTDFKLAGRVATTARLNRPSGRSGRKTSRTVAPAGKAVPKRAKSASKRIRKAKPQAWIVAARTARKPQRSSARIIAFPAAATRSSQQRLRKAA
jgi:hypothetical protein